MQTYSRTTYSSKLSFIHSNSLFMSGYRMLWKGRPLFRLLYTLLLMIFSKQNQFILFHVLTPKQSKIENSILFHFMPVGVPKVPFLIPGDEDASWVDLYNCLFHKRILFLGQEIKCEISNQIVGLMVYLSIEDKDKDLYLLINSPGGNLMSGMAIFDAMHFVEAEVQTVCVGLAASMSSLLLIGGEITKRTAFPHSWRQ